MPIRAVLLLALSACATGPDTGAPDTGPAPHCANSAPGPVPGYAAYQLTEVELPSGDRDAANWAWRAAPSVAVAVDLDAFAARGVDEDVLLDVLGRATHFWNEAAAGFNLTVGEAPAIGAISLTMHAAGDGAGLPAYTHTEFGDDPSTPDAEPGCLVASDVRFFPDGIAADGTPVRYRWVASSREVTDLDATDGTVDKPLQDTLVHELGHALGLDDQDDPSVDCSVMAHCADPACGCSFDTIGPVDRAALRHVYGGG